MRIFLKRGVSPLVATIILGIIGVLMTFTVLALDGTGSSNETATYKLFIPAVYQVSPISIDNAEWQIALLVENQGNREVIVDKVYINGKLVEEMGLIHGELLSSSSVIGVSVPTDGLAIDPKSREVIYVWIGSDLFSSGTQMIIELQKPNQFDLKKTIVLK